MGDLLQILRWLFLLGCVLPLVVMIVLSAAAYYFGRRWVENFIEPDVDKLHDELLAMREKAAGSNDDKLIAKVMHRQALKCGVVGALTGFGGFVTLPIALPVDMLLSARYQAVMVSFIAQIYGYENPIENKVATYAVMTGTTEVTKVTSRVLQKYAPRFVGKLSSKLVPVVGALIAFVVNYVMARSMGRLAIKWYESKSRGDILRTGEMPATA